MPDLITVLREEHEQMARLLRVVERELERVREGGNPHFTLLIQTMKYLTHYPDAVHHPQENVLFEMHRERMPGAAAAIDRLRREHEMLHDQGREFLELVEAAAGEHPVERETFESLGRAYLRLQRDHMAFEEDELFPLAEKALGADDFKAVEKEVARSHDPLFGEITRKEYQSLYRYITRIAEETAGP